MRELTSLFSFPNSTPQEEGAVLEHDPRAEAIEEEIDWLQQLQSEVSGYRGWADAFCPHFPKSNIQTF